MCASSDVLTRITLNPETLSACLTMLAFLFVCLFVFVCLFICFVLFFCFCVAPECNKPLGMQDGTISDGQISASSERRLYFGPENARLNFSSDSTRVAAWMPENNDANQWLQVDFGNETIVTGIDTQGRASNQCPKCDQWVKNYTVSYRQDNATFRQYKENGNYTKVENSVDSILSVSWMSLGSRAVSSFFHCNSRYQRNSTPTQTETPSSVTCWVPPWWRGTSASILQTGAATLPWGWSSGDAEQVRLLPLPRVPPPPPPLPRIWFDVRWVSLCVCPFVCLSAVEWCL